MVLESHEPRTETYGDFMVAGVAHSGNELDKTALWADLEEHEEDLEGNVVDDDYYGVYYDIDEDEGTFTYVAGVRVDSKDGLPPELTVVDVPETTWAVFATTGEALEDFTVDVEEGEFGDVDHDEGIGVMVERYDPDASPAELETDLEFYVPVEPEDGY